MTLLSLQHDFRTWLTSQSEEHGRRLDKGRGGSAVYLNNYRSALIACLAESFPNTLAWIGGDMFEATAAFHIERMPPHSWTLDAYALDFPETLAIRFPDDPEVVELAQLERALGVAFVGPDAEPVDTAALAEVDWDRATLRFVPTLTILPALTNATQIWSAITDGETSPAAAALSAPSAIAVWRRGLTPSFRTLDPAEARALTQVNQGLPFAALCAQLVESHGEEEGPALAGELLGQWLRDLMIVAVD